MEQSRCRHEVAGLWRLLARAACAAWPVDPPGSERR